MFLRSFILKTSDLRPVRSLVTRSFLFRPLVRRFIAGENLDDVMLKVEALASEGYSVSLDMLGENVANEQEALAVLNAYTAIVERVGASKHVERMNVSIKPTHFGIDLGDEVAERNIRSLLTTASKYGLFVRIDMESSEYTERTVAMLDRVWKDFKNTGTVLQSMMRRTLDDVEHMIELGARVRLVKGAYLEPAAVAHQAKSKVDEVYVEAAKRLLERGNYPAIATHDERIINQLSAFIKEKGIEPSRYEWRMLYGIRRDLQEQLMKSGQNVRVYVPYGSHWYPYFSRRLAERPANVLFIMKALFHK